MALLDSTALRHFAPAPQRPVVALRYEEQNKSQVRARVEHVFAVFKRLWGFAEVRYRDLAKNAASSFVVLGLPNIDLARGQNGRDADRIRPVQAFAYRIAPSTLGLPLKSDACSAQR